MEEVIEVNFYNDVPDIPMLYVVIIARYKEKWVFARHKDRDTYEIPGGHIEDGEDYFIAARRELYEETGAIEFKLDFVSIYSVKREDKYSGGYLFFADITKLSSLPSYEMEEIFFFDRLPTNLTYPYIQPVLFHKAQGWLNIHGLSQDELWDTYDKDRNVIGKTHRRGDPMEDGEFHLVVIAWIMNKNGEFLITKRSKAKGYPNMWECTGGAAVSGDTSLTAVIREVKEETGLNILEEKGEFLFTVKRENSFLDIWLFRQDVEIDEVILDKNETCDVKWATKDEINKMMDDGEFISSDYINRLFEMIS